MTKTGSSTLLLSLGDRESRVRLTGEDGVSREFVLALGLDAMTPGPFSRDPPTSLELEQAIMVVEDVLMPLAARIPPHPLVQLHSPVPLAEALGSRVQSRESIERLFGQLVAMVEGDPLASAQLPRDRRVTAALLILREWMHHLNAGSVALVDE
ncbi:hypothetical protein [Aeromonas rivipollensis]|uniref:hypothetical protein n=1 Tax=Aeromonas rivipollensis TaxID=948519 RepID=UPI0027D9802F|nr:hypothetical protein [uncultured Aeromonas sp.]MDU1145088.1 hypothetical protein [Aeromonas hydrophila]